MRLFGLSLLVLALLAAEAAQAGYVLYYRVFGNWTVVCERDMASGTKACTMSTPPPQLSGGMERLKITETGPDAFRLTAEMAPWADPAQPLSLRVDGHTPHPVTAKRWGPVVWEGGAAAILIGQMASGRTTLLRSHDQTGGPRDESFDLTGFAPALTALRQNLRAHGIVGGK